MLLLNGQSTLYELAHKPDLIGMAAFALLAGREPDGTIGFLYPAFDAAAILLVGWIGWRLVRAARRMRRGESVAPRLLGHLWLGVIVAVWLDAIIPFELFFVVPNLLAAPWTSLVRIDLGQVLFAFALLRLTDRHPAGHRGRSGDPDPLGGSGRPRHAPSAPGRLRPMRELRAHPRLGPPSPRSRRAGARGGGGGRPAARLALAVGPDRPRPESRRLPRLAFADRDGLGVPPSPAARRGIASGRCSSSGCDLRASCTMRSPVRSRLSGIQAAAARRVLATGPMKPRQRSSESRSPAAPRSTTSGGCW